MDFFINSLPQVISHEQGYHIWQKVAKFRQILSKKAIPGHALALFTEIPKLGQFQALW